MAGLLLLLRTAHRPGGARLGGARLAMSLDQPREPSWPASRPPEILSEILEDELAGDASGEFEFDQLLQSRAGAAELARDVILEDLALSIEYDETDMPADFDLNSQTWLDYNFVADYGFDPLGLAFIDLHIGGALDKDRPLQIILRDYREAELRHGRLAMLAALAWPMQELFNPILSRLLHEPQLLAETGGRSPSLLNGGLEQGLIPYTLAILVFFTAIVDTAGLRRRESMGENWIPGDFGFDPLNLLGGATLEARRDMQEKEINNGRLAMVAVLVYVIEEAVTGRPIVDLTPFLFQPFFANAEVQHFLDFAFAN